MTRARFRAIFLAAIMVLSVVAMGAGFVGGAAAQSGDELVVDQAEGDGTDYTTIQEAVNNAETGDTILVRDGTYDRFDRVEIDDLTITAADGASPTISASAEELPESGRIVDIGGESVEFSGINVVGPESGVGVGVRLGASVNTDSSEVSGVTVRNVLTGIQTGDVATNAQIVDNEVSNAVVGVSLLSDSATVSGNEFASLQANEDFPGEGIGIAGTGHTIEANTISADDGVVDVRVYNSDVPTVNEDDSGDEISVANTILDVSGVSSVEFTNTDSLYDGSVTIDDTSYATIEGAAGAAASGDTIEVAPGTYDEDVSIETENVSLVGTGDDTVIEGLVSINAEESALVNLAVEPEEFVRPKGDRISPTERQAILITASNASVYNSSIDVSLDANGGFEEVNAIQVFGANSISGVQIIDNEITGTAENDDAAGVVGVSDQAETNDTVVYNNTIDVDAEGYSFGVVTRASNGTNVGETPTSIVVSNDISATADIPAAGIGYGIESSDTAQVDAGAQLVKDNTFVDAGSVVHKGDSGTLDVTMNEWNDLENVSFLSEGHKYDRHNGGEIVYDPFLTSSPPNASDFTQPGERTDFGHDLVIPADGDVHSIAFPASIEGTVSEVFDDFDGTVYAYDGDEWVTGEEIADEEIGALDAFAVSVDEDEDDLRITFEYTDGDSDIPSMTTADLDAGWNFVGAPHGNAPTDEAFVGSTADVTTVVDALGGPDRQTVPYDLTASSEVTNPGRVSPFQGYWVFATDDGELGATVPVGPTQETEEDALTGN